MYKRIEFEKRAKRGAIILTVFTLILVGVKGFVEYDNPIMTLIGLIVGLFFAVVGWVIGMRVTRWFFNFEGSESEFKKRFGKKR